MSKQLSLEIEKEEGAQVDIRALVEEIKSQSAEKALANLANLAMVSKNSQVMKLYFQVICGWSEKDGFGSEIEGNNSYDLNKLSDDEKLTLLRLTSKAKKQE